MTRRRLRALQGALFGVFAAPGWAALHCLLHPGHPLWAEIASNPLLYEYLVVGAAAGFAVFGAVVGHHEDALVDANRRLDDLAVSDPLTGLKNVRYFRPRLEEARAASLRSGDPLSVLVLDLDGFKQVNDRHGHPTGDRLLRRVAETIATCVREGDTAARLSGNVARLGGSVARMGGEEFAVLLPGATALEALRVAERLLHAVRGAGVHAGDGEVSVTASLGVAELRPGISADALYARADQAMYASKAAGRDRVSTWAARDAFEAAIDVDAILAGAAAEAAP
ncbi:MAG TPA: GGDEF domain-containing protein [Longimicrobium sp.]|nr:GGDEF domain-containing protein [Longimicrobium sp.]